MEITVQKQIDNLNRNAQEFARCIELLPDSLFLKKMDGWAPRDVTAHLIGWNLYTIRGCLELINGKLPFYFIDSGDDFRNINALSIKKYGSKGKNTLLKQLSDTLEKLRNYLLNVNASDWNKDFGILYRGNVITIRNTVDALISEYVLHKQQIEKWAKNIRLEVPK